jgi:hypothetical protein
LGAIFDWRKSELQFRDDMLMQEYSYRLDFLKPCQNHSRQRDLPRLRESGGSGVCRSADLDQGVGTVQYRADRLCPRIQTAWFCEFPAQDIGC